MKWCATIRLAGNSVSVFGKERKKRKAEKEVSALQMLACTLLAEAGSLIVSRHSLPRSLTGNQVYSSRLSDATLLFACLFVCLLARLLACVIHCPVEVFALTNSGRFAY